VVDGAQWVGELWRAATHELGGQHLHVHRAGLERSSWSSLVCFAGRGPGEVFTGERKLVGVSQRRTRDWIRLQTLIHHVWDPARTLDVLELAPTARHQGERDLSSIVATADGDTDTVVAAVVAHLPT
jgi:lipoate-protein ligase A